MCLYFVTSHVDVPVNGLDKYVCIFASFLLLKHFWRDGANRLFISWWMKNLHVSTKINSMKNTSFAHEMLTFRTYQNKAYEAARIYQQQVACNIYYMKPCLPIYGTPTTHVHKNVIGSPLLKIN